MREQLSNEKEDQFRAASMRRFFTLRGNEMAEMLEDAILCEERADFLDRESQLLQEAELEEDAQFHRQPVQFRSVARSRAELWISSKGVVDGVHDFGNEPALSRS